jgi:hypothetical protein
VHFLVHLEAMVALVQRDVHDEPARKPSREY